MKLKILIFILLVAFTTFSAGCKKDKKPLDPIADIDGNSYKTVKIGSQLWMAENLKTTKYNDGKDIPLTTDASAWDNLTTGGYCWYNNDAASNKETYGALYNGFSIVTGKLCPDGWHVPEAKEWRILREFLGDSVKAGGKLKESGTEHWLSPNKGADNSSDFTALPAGIRYFEGTFSSILSYTCIWSATEVSQNDEWCISLYFAENNFIMDHRSKNYGFSVRCLKD